MPWFDEATAEVGTLRPQLLSLRQGDRLSTLNLVIEDEYGTPLDLTDARCYVTARSLVLTGSSKLLDRAPMVIEAPLAGQVSYDWQASDTLEAAPGEYELLIDVEYADRTVTVPSNDQAFTINLSSHIAGDAFVVDETGALIPDGAGGFKRFNPLLTEAGEAILLEDGSYLMYD